MNGLDLRTVIPGRNKTPGIYSSNFDPTANSTLPILTRLAIGAIVIQTATVDAQCNETCTLALWIKTCPADCDDSTWQSINLGAVVIPPDVYCNGFNLVGNTLTITLTNMATYSVDLSPLVYVPPQPVIVPVADTAGWADPNNPTEAEFNAWIVSNPQAAGTLVALVGSGTTNDPDWVWEVGGGGVWTNIESPAASAPVRVNGISPFVINPSTGNVSWALNQTESTPIATLTITNPSPTKPLQGMLHLYHGLLVRSASTGGQSPKADSMSAQSVISLDDGGGTLQNPVLYPLFLGSSQIAAQAVRHDPGQSSTSAGNQTQHTMQMLVTIAPGATVTFRSQSTMVVHDGEFGTVWTYNRILFDGMVY